MTHQTLEKYWKLFSATLSHFSYVKTERSLKIVIELFNPLMPEWNCPRPTPNSQAFFGIFQSRWKHKNKPLTAASLKWKLGSWGIHGFPLCPASPHGWQIPTTQPWGHIPGTHQHWLDQWNGEWKQWRWGNAWKQLLQTAQDCWNTCSNACINIKPEGGTTGICGAFDFSEEFLVKIPTVGPQNLVKQDQISPGVP